METLYTLLLAVVVGCTAEVLSSSCVDHSRLLCSVRSADCDKVESVRAICPATCKLCSPGSFSYKTYNLTYFDFKARAEQLRWILVQADANWTDTRVSQDDWPALKPKTLTGQMPYLEVEGTTIAQSGAIAMYLGRELGLAGRNNLETAQVQMIWDTVQEAFNGYARCSVVVRPNITTAEKTECDDAYKTTQLARLMNLLETMLKDGDDWLVGNKLTLADIVTASFFELGVESHTADARKNSPKVSGLYVRVLALPRIKNWIATRPKTDF